MILALPIMAQLYTPDAFSGLVVFSAMTGILGTVVNGRFDLAVMHVASRTKMFDFEGSMIVGVENSFRQFGAVQMPYFQIQKDPLERWCKLAYRIFAKISRSIYG